MAASPNVADGGSKPACETQRRVWTKDFDLMNPRGRSAMMEVLTPSAFAYR